jgi:hypothetical protein
MDDLIPNLPACGFLQEQARLVGWLPLACTEKNSMDTVTTVSLCIRTPRCLPRVQTHGSNYTRRPEKKNTFSRPSTEPQIYWPLIFPSHYAIQLAPTLITQTFFFRVPSPHATLLRLNRAPATQLSQARVPPRWCSPMQPDLPAWDLLLPISRRQPVSHG